MKILIADDDGSNLLAYEALFEHAGHQVFTAQNGEIALELLKKNSSIDVLLTDLNMPGIDGLETITEAKKIKPGVRAFLGSGTMKDATKQRAKSLGAEGTFDKPYDIEQICEVLKK
jgi:CheY-like chemotaxis protein